MVIRRGTQEQEEEPRGEQSHRERGHLWHGTPGAQRSYLAHQHHLKLPTTLTTTCCFFSGNTPAAYFEMVALWS